MKTIGVARYEDILTMRNTRQIMQHIFVEIATRLSCFPDHTDASNQIIKQSCKYEVPCGLSFCTAMGWRVVSVRCGQRGHLIQRNVHTSLFPRGLSIVKRSLACSNGFMICINYSYFYFNFCCVQFASTSARRWRKLVATVGQSMWSSRVVGAQRRERVRSSPTVSKPRRCRGFSDIRRVLIQP